MVKRNSSEVEKAQKLAKVLTDAQLKACVGEHPTTIERATTTEAAIQLAAQVVLATTSPRR